MDTNRSKETIDTFQEFINKFTYLSGRPCDYNESQSPFPDYVYVDRRNAVELSSSEYKIE